jgi:hypothetical protein
MFGLGRFEEVRDRGRAALEASLEIGLDVLQDHIELPVALSEAKLGEHASACERLDRIIEKHHKMETDGLPIGWAYEERARIALWCGDQPGFEHFAERCRKHYKKSGGNRAVAAKYERLIQEGRHFGLVFSPGLATSIASGNTTRATGTFGPATTRTHLGDDDDLDVATVIESGVES